MASLHCQMDVLVHFLFCFSQKYNYNTGQNLLLLVESNYCWVSSALLTASFYHLVAPSLYCFSLSPRSSLRMIKNVHSWKEKDILLKWAVYLERKYLFFFFLRRKSSFHTETIYERIERISLCRVVMSEKNSASCGLVNNELGLLTDFLLFWWESLVL